MPDARPCVSITSQSRLESLVEHIRALGQFAFDTEFVSEDSYDPELGLIQVATREQLATVDPLAVPDLMPFWELINDPGVEVVMHAPAEDLRICKNHTGRLPDRVVDVQRAAGLVGLNYPSGLGNLTMQCLRVPLDGRETRSDWRKRPLSPAQLRYALDDVKYLLELYDHIYKQLQRLDRATWAEAEYAELLKEVYERESQERWRRLPGLAHLNRRGLEYARRLWEWRRDAARRLNQPVRRVMRDDLLVAIAKRQPTHRQDLEALRDFQRPHLLAQSGEIVKLLGEARVIPEESLPARAERIDESRGSSMVVNLLMAVLHRCCNEQAVSVALAGSTSDLRALLHWYTLGSPEAETPALATGWRREVCGNVLLDVIGGRRSLRILDPNAELPVAIDPFMPL
jgi:ribonuclease D